MLSLALLAILAQNAPATATATAAVQGLVTRTGSGDALPKAVVELRGNDERMPPLAATTTEADGRFVFRNVPAGRYQLAITRPGYVSRQMNVTTTAGRTEEAVIAMTATGVIAGRVYGQAGEPLGNIDVAALKFSFQNRRRVLTPIQAVRSNDRGEYRLFWLAPGRYIVRATHPQAESGPMAMLGRGRMGVGVQTFMGVGGLGPGGISAIRSTGDSVLADAFGPGVDPLPDRYVPVYFPGTTDDEAAAAIEVRAGADVSAIDVPVTPVRERHVRGVVINGATGQIAQYASLTEVRADDPPGGAMGGPGGGLSNAGLAPIDPDGAFDVTLRPGRHTLKGTTGTAVGYVSFDVRDADIDGVRIVAVPEFSVTGRISTDAPVGNADLGTIRISFQRELPVATPSSSYSLPRADGTFVATATAGDYRVHVAPFLNLTPGRPGFTVTLPKALENAYVKSIRLGELDVLNGGVHFEGPTASRLEIVLGMNPGSVEGTVLSDVQSARAGATVVLLPNVRGRFDLVKVGTTNAAGLFRLEHVAPGDYQLFAWDEVGDGDWHDPAFMRTYDDRGAPIRISEGATQRVRLTTIAP